MRSYLKGMDMKMARLAAVLLLMASLHVVQVHSGSIQKRAAGDEEPGDIHRLIDDIGGRKEVDLILILDRSHSMSRETFYLHQKKLAQNILKQYATLDTKYVRLSVITFARDSTIVFDSISNPDNTPNKCSLFYGERNLWDNNVTYTQVEENLKGTNIKEAFIQSIGIFENGKKYRTGTRKVILIMTDGKYNSDFDPINEANELMITHNVTIYAVGVGTWREIGNVRVFTSKHNDVHLYGEFDDWKQLARQSAKLLSYNTDTEQEWTYIHSCTAGCGPNSKCYCDVDRGVHDCLCLAGYHLNEATETCEECAKNTTKSSIGNATSCTACPPGNVNDGTANVQPSSCYCLIPPCTDPCDNISCNSNQECQAVNETSAICVCKNGWEGIACDVNTNECETNNNKCKNDAKCVDGLGTGVYSCVCSNWGYIGQYCEINQNECTPDMCINNSTCEDKINNFQCMCEVPWKGRYCQDEEEPTTTTTTTTTTPAPPTTTGPPIPEDKTTLWIIIGASAGGGLLLIIIIIIIACCVCKKRRVENKQEVKNVAQQFSGFWKKRTIRGSKYVKEMEEDANGGLPSAPYAHRPDLIESTDGPYEDLKTDEYAELPYQTMTLKTGMESWQNYITELEEAKTVESALITKLNGNKKATTGAWMYDPSEVSRMETLMDQKDENVPLVLQDGEYYIQENDGTMAVGRTIGDSQEAKMVAIGRTRTYLIVAISVAATDDGKARKEVQWVVDHISGEGY